MLFHIKMWEFYLRKTIKHNSFTEQYQ